MYYDKFVLCHEYQSWADRSKQTKYEYKIGQKNPHDHFVYPEIKTNTFTEYR